MIAMTAPYSRGKSTVKYIKLRISTVDAPYKRTTDAVTSQGLPYDLCALPPWSNPKPSTPLGPSSSQNDIHYVCSIVDLLDLHIGKHWRTLGIVKSMFICIFHVYTILFIFVIKTSMDAVEAPCIKKTCLFKHTASFITKK